MTDTILELEAQKVVLSYDDLRPGGTLADSVGVFTLFPDLVCNEAFLNLINYTEVCELGDGLCKNMVRYPHVGVQERRRFQEDQDAMAEGNAGNGLAVILVAINVVEDRGGRTRQISWNTEWLVYCFLCTL